MDSAQALWELVSTGTDAVGGFPTDRGWDLAALYDPDPDAVGKTYTRSGAFLAEAAGFDAEFFGISAREATAMDPQQRLLLEVCWEALETAGIDPTTLEGTNTGVFAGIGVQGYGTTGSQSAEGYGLTGAATSVASGRIAYVLGLQGPAITIDTACSSSLVATHLACQSLRNGESGLALAGGVTVMATPAPFIEFARQRGLATDGRCKAFAAAADGTGWGEGAAILVLERLSDAHQHHHPVLAVIAGSAVNQDGASNGLTAPNGPAQQRVITQAAANAGIPLDHVDVVEAHGTGTTLGDPIEAGALLATYGASRDRQHPLWLGSVKSNIGHTQAAAGTAGLIKMITALNHAELPPTLHIDQPSPHIDWSTGAVQLLTQTQPWPTTNHPRTAAVSSFGVSGTNAHLILQQPPTPPPTPTPTPTPTDPPTALRIWPLSARTPTALHAQAARLHHHLLDHPNLDLTDLAHSLATTRTHHPHRAALTIPTTTTNPREDLLAALHALATNHPHPHLTRHHLPRHPNKTVFVFPGQGAQYPTMATGLYTHHHTFTNTLNECDHALHPWTGWSVRDVLTQHPSAPPLHRVDVIQPVLFAIMISLAELLRTHGIIPDAVIGHSQGEIAAAYIAGALPLDQAAKIVALRSQALTALSGHGAMASVRLSPHELHPHLQPWNTTLTIAATNGPTHTIISGDPTALEQFTTTCQHHGIHIRPIAVDYASHSPHVEHLHQHLLHQLGELTPQPAQIPLYTTVQSAQTNHPLDTTTMNADYWYRNLREPVEFHNTITTLLTQGPHTFIELSPHPVLAPALTDTITTTTTDQTQSTVITTLHRDHPDLDTLTTTLAHLHTHGHSPTWTTLYPTANTTQLPTYPFQHHPYWLTPPTPTTNTSTDPAEGRLWNAVDADALDTVAQVLGIDDDHPTASLAPMVTALRQWRKQLGDRSLVDKLRYRVSWQAINPTTFPQTRQRWLVLTHPDQSDEILTGLSAHCADAPTVLAIDTHNTDRNELATLLVQHTAANDCDGVLSLLALHDQTHPDLPGPATGLLATLLAAQAYGDSGLTLPLWVLTQGGAQLSADNDPLTPSQSAVWGLGQSVCLEHPDWWGGLIDLPATPTPQDFKRLHTLLTCPQPEDQLAIRAHGVHARRLNPAPLPPDRARTWKPTGTALITGVTGPQGPHIARWLAHAGASHLVLLSRTAADHPGIAQLEQELHTAGITTTAASVDVTDRHALAAVIDKTRTEHGPIHTVVHAAAFQGWATIAETTPDEFRETYTAKVLGAENLITLLNDEPPHTFIMFSSAAATWGGTRQGAYAAANAHIEALTTKLRAHGHHALAPAWGTWADDRTTTQQTLDYLARIGLNQIPTDTAFTALQQSLDIDDTLITLTDVDWDQFHDVFTTRRAHPLLAQLGSTQPHTTPTTPAIPDQLGAQLAGQTPPQQLATLTTLVVNATATVLAHPDPTTLDPDQPFKNLGIDSLTALQLRNTLTRHTGLPLPATLVFDHPTPTTIAQHLTNLLTGTNTPTTTTPTPLSTDEPIAVVGMACRLPGGVDSAQALWELVSTGTDAVGGFPTDRGWDLAALYDPDPDAVGKTYTRSGAFLAEAAGFDAEFFGISAREATAMDPQQRLLLEVCWEALETAGIDPTTLEGTNTGVFAGIGVQGYGTTGSQSAEGYGLTGAATSVASGRIAYVLGLQGPAITIDTACSSSLVATHLACQSLRNGESGLALAGGVTVMATPAPFIEFARQRGLATDGRCKAFAAAADGTGWGEGAAILVLERLSDAHQHHHPVLAVIAGSAVNQDGASNGLTAPNGPAQQRVITQAAANAGIPLDHVDVVEAHGTGTTLGDPIEAGALLATYGASRDRQHPLWLGSVKSNIGHTQAAAGTAGLIKMITALNHAELPPTLHIDQPSPHIDWSTGAVQLLTQTQPWPTTNHPRTAAVSSFGISGTNAHLILQQPPTPPPTPTPTPTPTDPPTALRIWPLSARTPTALHAQAARLHHHLLDHPNLDLTDLAHSLATTRTHHPHRAALTIPTTTTNPREDLLAALHALATNHPHPHLTRHHLPRHPNKTVFVFPGQGAQYPTMATGLYTHHHTFTKALDEVCAAFDPHLDVPLTEVMFAAADTPTAQLLQQTHYAQPALFAFGVAMHAVLTQAGINPDYLLGHSVGELTAAHIAGVFSLDQAALLVSARGRLMQACAPGAMLAITASQPDITAILHEHPGLTLAAVNGPTSVVVSGPADQINTLRHHCTTHHYKTTPLRVSHAFHSAAMDPALPEFEHITAGLTLHPPQLPVLSNLTGQLATTDQLTSPHYWTQQLRQPVRFHDNITTLLTQGPHTFIELSPHPVLAPALTDTITTTTDQTQSTVITTLHRDHPDLDTLTTTLAHLHTHGHSPTWTTLYPTANTTQLPTYPFQHHPYWLTPPTPTTNTSTDPAEGRLWNAVDADALDTVAQVLGIDDDHPTASLAPMVTALRQWRKQLGDRSLVDKLRYRVSWQAINPTTFPQTRQRWLVLTHPDQSDEILTGLSAHCADAPTVLAIDTHNTDRNELATLLVQHTAANDCDGVLSLLALHDQTHPDLPGPATGLLATLLAAQAYGDSGLTLPLWVLTQGGAQLSADNDPLTPSQSAVWGLGQSVCLEHPDWWGGLIDLPATPTPQDFKRLHTLLTCPQPEDQLAIRAHGVHARRLNPAPLPPDRARTWKPTGTALITGVTGQLGPHIARWLAHAGASHLVLLSRTAADHPGIAQLQQELHTAGITTTAASVDVTDRHALAAVIDKTRTEHGPIHTVVHAAAFLGWATIAETTPDEFRETYTAKVLGAENLITLLNDEPPHTFIMFSSAAATWGGTRQGAYAAANAHIEALTTKLRAHGHHALAPAWGTWADDRTTTQQTLDYLARIGLNQIPTDTAFTALQQSLDIDDTLITLTDVDWDQFHDVFTTRRAHPLLAQLGSTQPHTTPTTPAIPDQLGAQLAGQTPPQQLATLTTLVVNATATVLAHPDPTTLDPDQPFKNLGIDSLTALQLRNTLTRHTGLPLPATLVFDHPTPTTIAQHLTNLLTGTNTPTTTTPTPLSTDEPIAVVGMACRLPGGVDSAQALWELVSTGTDAVGGFPTDRGWDLAALYDPDPDAVGKTYTRSGAFLAEAAGFDAEFFGISAREATAMDPQQRLLLEVCWEALETAGIDPTTLEGTNTGVFAGAWAQDYGTTGSQSAEGYGLTGAATSVASGRIAYVLGLQGPAITIDTACSSSLVATHLACQSLRNGESGLALAGGVTVMATPAPFIEFARQRGLATDGRCKAFAAAADGTGWGEGAAILVLERLSDAHQHHHPVLAVIAGSAVNQDGASNGLTAPNGPAQQRVITQAAANAGIPLDHVDVVEAHGTGTTLGDPIEAGALLATYGASRDRQHPLWLGSVKSNIGHTQAAAGTAGLIKMITALNHAELPPTLHIDQPSPHIDWSTGAVQLLTQTQPWPTTNHPRTAAVSSFGVSGTNAHLILQQPPTPPPTPTPTPTPTDPPTALRIWPLSARTPTALHAQAARLHHHLLDHPNLDLTDLAHSLATTRTHHPHRAALTIPTTTTTNPREDLLAALHALATNHPHPHLTRHHLPRHPNKTVFVFPGQGAQYPTMATGLYTHHHTFTNTLNECDHALHPWTGWSVRDVLTQHPSAPPLHRVDVIQPVLFAIMISLAELLRTHGIIPDAVIGHSQGEIAAAYIAGALPLDQAAKIVALRSQALTALSGHGAMASVRLSPHELHPHLQPWNTTLTIAATNGPTHTIISGDPTALEQFTTTCQHHGIHIRPIAVDYASHSPHVEHLHQHLLHQLGELTPQPAQIPLYTTVQSAQTNHPLDTTTMNADYWYRNLREPVEFHNTITTLLTQGPHTFIELSPHPVLAPALTDTITTTTDQTQSTVITTLHRDHPDLDTLTTTLAHLHTHGHSPTWTTLYPTANTTQLPTYPFQHHPYWLTPPTAVDVSAAGLDKPDHPLLGAVTDLADQDQIVLTGRLSTTTHNWLAGHKVQDTVVFPGTGYIDLLLQAGEYVNCPVIDELVLHTPLALVEHTPTDVQITVQTGEDNGRRPFTLYSRTGGTHNPTAWTLHATGALTTNEHPASGPPSPPSSVDPIDQDSFYHDLAEQGFHYEPPFRSLQGIGHHPTQKDTVYAEVALPADIDITGYGIHPALLDAAMHPLAAAFYHTDNGTDPATPRLPFAFAGVTLHAIEATRLHVQLTSTGADTFKLHATDPTGAPVITINTLTLRARPDHISSAAPGAARDSLFQLNWPCLPDDVFPMVATSPVSAVVTADPDHLPASLHNSPIYTDLAHTDLAHTDLVVWPLPLPDPADADHLQRAHTLTQHTVTQLQDWLTRPDTLDTHLVIITCHAVSINVYDQAPDLAHAAAWALIHTAQNEHPGRITVLDTDSTPTTDRTIRNVLAALAAPTPAQTAPEPQLALRHGIAHTPRLTPPLALTPPQTPTWQLAITDGGGPTNLALVPTEPATVLAPGQIRVAIRAAGLSFHDVDVASGAVSDDGIGREGAGVVIETAPDVTTVGPGDAVMGLFPGNAFAPIAITDHRMVVAIPAGWSFSQAASVPVAFLTAYTALVERAQLSAGQRVLIHAGTGGVGQAAIQIAHHLGAEVFATASPHKHPVLADLGIPDQRIASSRTLDFVDAFHDATDGQGIDVVLNSLRGDFIDGSLQLLSHGGCFVEIGNSDIRLASDVSTAHPGVDYQAYTLTNTSTARLSQTWNALTELFVARVLRPLPTTNYGLLQAPQAFRDMSQALHTGKIVLTLPTVLNPDGTVLITGGTGMLGRLFAEHLVTHYGVRHLLLVSRSGPNAPGAAELHQHLTSLGAQAQITACDTSNPSELTALLADIPAQHRLTAIIHTAGVLEDAVITEMTADQLDTILTAKADTAWHLHQLTTDIDLDTFVVFSSVSAVLGAPGQAAYAAANAFLDALAQQRHRQHHHTTSLAWGYWQTPSGMTAHLTSLDHTRMTRTGLTPIPTEHGLALFDTALTLHQPNLIPTPLNKRTLAQQARQHTLPPILSTLTTTRPQATTTSSPHGFGAQLAGQTPPQQLATLTTLVVNATATVLAHPDPTTLDPDQPFKNLGIDSLTALELRNTLTRHTGLPLPATLVFDHPTPTTIAQHLTNLLTGTNTPTTTTPTPLSTDEPIAVVGMACRLPGGVDSAQALWELVSTGTDAVGGFPTDRGWDLAALYDPDPDAVGKTYTRSGAFLAEAAGFDAEFFGISAREATAMDPQQRLLLEVCWEALETAGIDPTTLEGTNTGVFAGAWAQDYGTTGSQSAEGYGLTGAATSVASGRIAYVLGLQGPAITIDTACSSSLVATHLACQSLRNGESGLALAGGVTVMATPAPFIEFARQRGLATDGRCKAFAAAADGTGWGEGAAILVLERLSDAHQHHHPVLAVIAGSAVNQDGASNGLTAPNGPAQQRVITQAAANAGIPLDHVDVVEAHGTGTTLGDPIEAGALLATYGASRDRQHPLWLGSVKSNIGHTQAAAGTAGLIKMITALNHAELPPTLHIDQPSPHIDWSTGAVQLLTQTQPWPTTNHPRTAAVSSFGISGTNAHLILQQPPTPPPTPTPTPTPTDPPTALRIWPLSARTPTALHAQAARLHHHLLDHPNLDLTDLAHSLATTRTHHPHRAALTIPTTTTNPREDLLAALHALATNHPHPHLTRHHLPRHPNKTVFVFPGQGAQYPTMATGLYTHHHTFTKALDEVCAAFDPHLDVPLTEVMFAAADTPTAQLLQQTHYAQPALFAFGVAMHAVLTQAGINPDYLLGHSVGELTAAHIAGVFSLDQAALLVSARGRLMQACAPGAMLAITASQPDITAILHEHPGLTLAAVNGPTSVVVSGPADQINTLRHHCTTHHYKTTPLRVSHAFHSAAMDPALPEFEHITAGLTLHPPQLPVLSNLTGQLATTDQLTSPHYWTQQLRQPVRFHDNITTLLTQGPHTFIELSPHPVLAPALTDTITTTTTDQTQSTVITTLHRDHPDLDTLTTTLAHLHTHGHSPTWTTLYPTANTTQLPTYPFQHHPYWLTPPTAVDVSAAGLDKPDHPLLGAVTDLADQDQIVLTGRLSTTTHNWLAGHKVQDTVVFPGTGYIDLLLQAGEYVNCPVIDELVLHTPLALVEHTPTDVQITVQTGEDNGRRPFTLYSRTGGTHNPTAWTLHATGALTTNEHPASGPPSPPSSVDPIDQDSFYHDLAEQGFHYEPPFRSLQGIGHHPTQKDTVYAEVALPADIDITGYGIHPALLDAAMHPLAAAFYHTDNGTDPATPRLPFAFAGVTLHAIEATRLHVQLTSTGADTFKLHATDPTGAPVITINTLTLRAQPNTDSLQPAAGVSRQDLFELAWPTLSADVFPAAQVLPAWALISEQPQLSPAGLGEGLVYSDVAAVDSWPALVVWDLASPQPSGDHPDPLPRVHVLTRCVLAGLQSWLTDADPVTAHLVILTRHGVSISPDDQAPDLAHAAVRALIHTAQNEHPGRISAIDIDTTTTTEHTLIKVLAALANPARRLDTEPQLALRDGVVHAPRLTPAQLPAGPHTESAPVALDPEGTVLITGGTGMLGGVFAEHLITHYGVRHLVLLSRSGSNASGADDLYQRLTQLDAQVSIAACDASDPAQLAAVLAAIPTQHRLTAVVHTAGVLDDAVISELTTEQLDAVLTAKADAAWQLHRLTADADLDAFVVFSSAAGVLGAPGQANYAAANAFLDALAHQRHRNGLPATSLAWGYWQTASAMTAHLDAVDQARFTRNNLTPITTEHGLALFDAALTCQQPNLVPAPLNTRALARQARHGAVPTILTGLTTTRRQASTTTTTDTLTTQLAGQTPQQQLATLTSLVTTTTATVLAHPDPTALDPDTPFKDLGMDSLSALELRNTLTRHTGLPLPATLAFDHPTPTTIAQHLASLLTGTSAPTPTSIDHVKRIQELVASIPAERLVQANVLAVLQRLMPDNAESVTQRQKKPDIANMSLDDLVAAALDDH
ncbi:type I polyketide synthase [Mycobacterium decipiens]